MPENKPAPKKSKSSSQFSYYIKTLIFGLFVFAAFYGYLTWMGASSPLNKTVADTAIILMGFSMLLSGITYFWDAFDHLLHFRKQLGLIGYAYFISHFVLSFDAFTGLFTGFATPAFIMGAIASFIFTIMALISNHFAMKTIGPKLWRYILRTGYLAVIFTLIHVVLLRLSSWINWAEKGFATPPATSLIISVFMAIVILMRIALFIALLLKKSPKETKEPAQKDVPTNPTPSPAPAATPAPQPQIATTPAQNAPVQAAPSTQSQPEPQTASQPQPAPEPQPQTPTPASTPAPQPQLKVQPQPQTQTPPKNLPTPEPQENKSESTPQRAPQPLPNPQPQP